jgi:hypothetical protein
LLTQPFAEALAEAEAEKIIASAPHVACERDLAEGYDYLVGSIQGYRATCSAWRPSAPTCPASRSCRPCPGRRRPCCSTGLWCTPSRKRRTARTSPELIEAIVAEAERGLNRLAAVRPA